MRNTLRWIGRAAGLMVTLLLMATVFWPDLSAQVMAHATPSISPLHNLLAALTEPSSSGLVMAMAVLAAPFVSRADKFAAKIDAVTAQMSAIHMEAGDGPLSVEQTGQWEKLQTERAALKVSHTQAEQQEEYERTAPARTISAGNGTGAVPGGRVRLRAEDDVAQRGFRAPREFFTAVLENSGLRERAEVTDERLRLLAVFDKDDKKAAGELAFMLPVAFTPQGLKAAVGSDEQGEYDDRYGGFAVQTTRIAGMLQVGFEGDPTAGRTFPIPMETPSVEIEARTDKDHTTSVSGGLTVARRAEAAAAAASRGAMEMIKMRAASLFGMNYTTEELLADSPRTVIALVQRGFETQFPAHMLMEKLRGKGGDEYLGILTALAASSLGPTVSVAKEAGQVADTIVTANVIKMRARCWGYGQAIWLANQDTYPQLAGLSIGIGAAGALVYQTSVVEDRPDMLLGRPIFYTEFAATVGDQGDLILANWSQYLDGLYQPLQSAESMHVRFVNHERAFKLWLRNAGAPWWRTALTPNKSAATLSPFAVLDAR